MGRIATSVKDQIQKLKDRGMEFDCEESKDKEILLDIGYYRLGFYWNPSLCAIVSCCSSENALKDDKDFRAKVMPMNPNLKMPQNPD